jgi:nitrate reductase assembly molybdenum cofactor insertion protein NarJ
MIPHEPVAGTPAAPQLGPSEVRLLRDSAEWRMIGLLFECPGEGWHAHIAALAGEVEDERLRDAARASAREASEGMYHAIFGPGGPVSPREATYVGGVQLGYLLAELAAYYDAFAYRPRTEEPHDHVGVEAGFVAYLVMKQAFASFAGDAEHAAVTADAAARFRADHLARLAEPLAAKLDALRPCYLSTAADVLLERVGPAPAQPVRLAGVLVKDDPDVEMTCAAGGECEGAAACDPRLIT